MNKKTLFATLAASAFLIGTWAWAQQGGHDHQPAPPAGQAGQPGSGVGPGQPAPQGGAGTMMMGPGQPGMHGMMMGGNRSERPIISEILSAKDQIGLTAEQEKKLRSLRVDFAKEAIKRGAEIQIAEVDLRELLAAETPDLGKVEALVKRIAALRGELRFARIKVLKEGRAVLTADQRRKFEALAPPPGPGGMMGGMMQHMMGGMMHGGQEGHGTSPSQPGTPSGSQHGPAGSH